MAQEAIFVRLVVKHKRSTLQFIFLFFREADIFHSLTLWTLWGVLWGVCLFVWLKNKFHALRKSSIMMIHLEFFSAPLLVKSTHSLLE